MLCQQHVKGSPHAAALHVAVRVLQLSAAKPSCVIFPRAAGLLHLQHFRCDVAAAVTFLLNFVGRSSLQLTPALLPIQKPWGSCIGSTSAAG